MKYFAILKDSLREALDSTVLLVLWGLSTLVIVFVALLSFSPQPAEETMGQFMGPDSRFFYAINSHKPEVMMAEGSKQAVHRPVRFNLEKVTLLRGDANSPESDYELTITAKIEENAARKKMMHGGMPEPPDAEKKKLPLPTDEQIIKWARSPFDSADELGLLKFEKIELTASVGGSKTLRVVVLGTSRTHRIWASHPNIAGYPLEGISVPLGFQLYNLTSTVLAIGAWVAVLAGVVITSFFIPNMLRKGTIDLLLVKPIERWMLLVYKYIGGLSFIFLSTAYAIGGIWLVLGIRTGLWANGALVMILTITFFFAILYAVSTLVGVVTRSTVTAIMVTIGAWFCFFVIGQFYTVMTTIDRGEKMMAEVGMGKPEEQRWGDGYIAKSARVLHFVTPRTGDLNTLNDMLVFTDFMTGDLRDMPKLYSTDVNFLESLIVSTLWIALCLGLASLWFTYKDY
ncbi:MAG: hypothetical protein FJ303_18495 [Planctomycetes bacterium]|nr:hypothetical protein [Planctomycetota bacterium]